MGRVEPAAEVRQFSKSSPHPVSHIAVDEMLPMSSASLPMSMLFRWLCIRAENSSAVLGMVRP